ncbi:hypothetical protein ACFWAP_09100 [Streptomyces goshikiensis]|uniref:hypothetical protein n=1 Tax=Streptomyces goshikiensis TaxID=1942 RepID=UPI00365275EC
MIQILVSCNDRDRYPAWVDPTDQLEGGYVRPWFDLGTVQRISDDTQADADRHGHGSVDTIHVLAGDVSGQGHAVVVSICWMYLGGDKHDQAVEILQPDGGARYSVGADWDWYALSDDLSPIIPFTPDGI